MNKTHYLIVGSSHAALEGLTAIRLHDPDGALTLVTRDGHLPYSPTVLPYVVSGKSKPGRILLRDEAYFEDNKAQFVTGTALVALDTKKAQATFDNGETWAYEKLLLATGARPAIPPVSGLAETPFHVLRTLDDAIGLRRAIGEAKSAIVLGAGLVGMHGAENLAKAGVSVSVIEMCDQVLPTYFDAAAAEMIESAFTENGVRMMLGCTVASTEKAGDQIRVTLKDGESLEADLLLVATGVQPVIDFLGGSGVKTDRGILVDDTMATSAPNVWAAGDVAQARDFYRDDKSVVGILPNAVEQGRIAGMAMAGDEALKPFPGGVPINTYNFYGRQAISVGLSQPPEGAEVACDIDPANGHFRKIVLKDGRLLGISTVNEPMDAGIMWQLILRRTDLGPMHEAFLANPLETGRALMSSTWR
jgi:phenylglyoxylate dehydrogenase epsilon subunit